MSRLILALLLCALVPTASASRQYFEILEHAAEVERLRLTTSPAQLLYARSCDECPTLALSVDANSEFYDGKQRISLAVAAGLKERGGTILFNAETRRVTRIIFWQ